MCLYVNARIHMQIQYACVCVCVRVAGPYRQRLRLTTCSAEQEVQFYLAYFQALADATEIAQPANATHTQCVSLNRTHTHAHIQIHIVRACVRSPHCMQPPCRQWSHATLGISLVCVRFFFHQMPVCIYVYLYVCVCVCWLHFKV